MNTVAIRQRMTADASHSVHITLPPEMGDEVEVIIRPISEKSTPAAAGSQEIADVPGARNSLSEREFKALGLKGFFDVEDDEQVDWEEVFDVKGR